MKALRKLTISFMSLALSTLVTIWAFMWGWGLEPRSWAVIIWASILQFALAIFTTIGVSDP